MTYSYEDLCAWRKEAQVELKKYSHYFYHADQKDHKASQADRRSCRTISERRF